LRSEFDVHYQPIIQAQSGLVTGLEALARWQHPERGLLSSQAFIPLAEEAGLIGPITEWVLRTACRNTREWQAQSCPELRIAVNVSRRLFQNPELPIIIARVLAETGLSPKCLELEVTESLFIEDK